MARLQIIRDRQATARQAAARFVYGLYGATRRVHEKWDGPRFRLVDGRVWYEVVIVKEGFEIHDTGERSGT
jgi:hypothetical protein